MADISIADAARLAGKDRRTIERHLKSGVLSYTVDATGRRVIDTSELMRVYGPLRAESDVIGGPSEQRIQDDGRFVAGDEGEKAALKAHIATLERHVDELRQEKRELRAQVVGLLEYRRPTPPLSTEPVVTAAEKISVPVQDNVTNKPSRVDLIYLFVGIASIILAMALLWADGYRPWFLL